MASSAGAREAEANAPTPRRRTTSPAASVESTNGMNAQRASAALARSAVARASAHHGLCGRGSSLARAAAAGATSQPPQQQAWWLWRGTGGIHHPMLQHSPRTRHLSTATSTSGQGASSSSTKTTNPPPNLSGATPLYPPPVSTAERRKLEAENSAPDAGPLGNLILAFERRLDRRMDRQRDEELDSLQRFADLVRTLDGEGAPASADATTSVNAGGSKQDETTHPLPPLLDQFFNTSSSSSGAPLDLQAFLSGAQQMLEAEVAQHASLFAGAGVQPPPTGGDASHWAAARETLQLQVAASLCAYLTERARATEGALRPDASPLQLRAAFSAVVEPPAADPAGARVRALFPLFDGDGDGYLSQAEAEAAVGALVEPLRAAAGALYTRCDALSKSARRALPRSLRYADWDRLDFPAKRRCAFAFAEDRVQTAPTVWHTSPAGFAAAQPRYFPELARVAGALMDVAEDERWRWHDARKRRRRAALYGTLLFIGTAVLDEYTRFM